MEWVTEIGCAYDAVITVGIEGALTTNEIVVDIQFKDYAGNNLKEPVNFYGYCCVSSDGLVKETNTNSSETIIETYGNLEIELAKTSYNLITNATGHIDLSMIDSGSNSYYFCVVLPNGRLKVSDVITF